jgi:DNA-binding MarR family transcriptional regulator
MKPNVQIFPRHKSPGFVIYRAATQMKAGLTRAFHANGFNVTPEQWGILSSLRELEGVHQSALAERTAKDRHNITRILNLLEKGGLVIRELHERDKRCQRVFLTDEGRELQAKLIPIVKDFLDHALDGLTQKDLSEMTRILTHISSNLSHIGDLSSICDAGLADQDAALRRHRGRSGR